jgi:hypothetical protein
VSTEVTAIQVPRDLAVNGVQVYRIFGKLEPLVLAAHRVHKVATGR